MTSPNPVLGLIVCAAGGAETVRQGLLEPMVADGWDVLVTATPTAERWLHDFGELGRIADVTGSPVRVRPRPPGSGSRGPRTTCCAVVPATANTVAKMALGIADNQALTMACESLGRPDVPVVIFPRINAAHARHPAWNDHIRALQRAGAQLVHGDDVWPLHEPGQSPERALPWRAIRDRIVAASGR